MRRLSGDWSVTTDVVLKDDGVESRVRWEVEDIIVYLTPSQARRLSADLLVGAETIEPSELDDIDTRSWLSRFGLWILGACLIVGGFIDGSLG